MLHFDSDYMRGACREILDRLGASNLEQTPGYGSDRYTAEAERKILEACGVDSGRVFFLVGGTQTNATVIDGLLRRHQGVVAAESGHINVHEAGAIESTGHKVLALPTADGKLSAEQVDRYITDFYRDETYTHMVAPGMVYITHPTEFGGLYSLEELTRLSEVCRRHDVPLYLDGARMAYALGSEANDVSLKDIARLTDVFYIGGTKCGALFGEAVVCPRPELLPNFFTLIKQHGALMSKGRLLGLQFDTLFTGGLYERLGRHAVSKAMQLREGLKAKGYEFLMDSPTNQQFVILPNATIDRLLPHASFELWGPHGQSATPVRFVTDWATTDSEISELLKLL